MRQISANQQSHSYDVLLELRALSKYWWNINIIIPYVFIRKNFIIYDSIDVQIGTIASSHLLA